MSNEKTQGNNTQNQKGSGKGNIAKSIAKTAANAAASAAAKEAVRGVIKHGPNIAKSIARSARVAMASNHPEWYTADPTSQLVGLNFAVNKAQTYDALSPLRNDDVYGPTGPASAVGLSVLNVHPKSGDEMDGWESGVAQFFTGLRAANNSNVSYDVKEVGKYIDYVAHCHTLLAIAIRSIRILNSFDSCDATTPKTLFTACGLDYTAWRLSKAELTTMTQQFSNFVSTSLPLKMPYIDRKRWIYSNVFCDSDDAKATPIVISPVESLTLDGETKIGHYLPVYVCTYGNTKTSLATFRSLMVKAMDAFYSIPFLSNIAGDVIKAYGTEAFYPFWNVTPEERANYTYDQYILTQIQNATLVGELTINPVTSDTTGSSFTIGGEDSARTGVLEYMLEDGQIINYHKDQMSAGEILSVTRLTCGVDNTDTAPSRTLTWWGGEVALNLFFAHIVPKDNPIYQYSDNGGVNINRLFADMAIGMTGNVNDGMGALAVSQWAQVDMMPYVRPAIGNVGDTLWSIPLMDINNYALASSKNLRAFNYTASKSMLSVPMKLRVNNTTGLDMP